MCVKICVKGLLPDAGNDNAPKSKGLAPPTKPGFSPSSIEEHYDHSTRVVWMDSVSHHFPTTPALIMTIVEIRVISVSAENA